MKKAEFLPIILAGGSGTRLWPVSRMSYPKQFCELLDDTLLNKTIQRLKVFAPPILLTSLKLKPLSERALYENQQSPANVLLEPQAKNTAAAMAYLCHTYKSQPDLIVGVFPSDHWIENTEAFKKDIDAAIGIAATNDDLVLLGIQPSYPSTGYGYIKTTGDVVTQFIEKPKLQVAEHLCKEEGVLWNSGIFICSIRTLEAAFRSVAPDYLNILSSEEVSEAYAKLAETSFDYAVVEKLKTVRCVAATFEWSDLGSWDQLAEKYSGTLSSVYELDSKNNTVISSRSKATGFIDVEDLLVVDTKDALLIAKKGSTQKVKQLTDLMLVKNDRRAIDPVKELRGWGEFTILEEDTNFKVKKVKILPQKSISYQSHKRRQEHWIILKGEAEVILDDTKHLVKEGESIFVKSGVKHLIRAISSTAVEMIEVQTGDYFGEDDIEKY